MVRTRQLALVATMLYCFYATTPTSKHNAQSCMSQSCVHAASAGNVLQYTQLASVLMQAGQFNKAEALLHQLLLHVETIRV